jgi:DNA-binding response OmpR family regulator
MIEQSQSPRATILLVEDDHALRESFARILTRKGYHVLTALDGQSGLHEAEASHVDAILLDLRMSGVDGLTFLRRLRALEHQRVTPVAVVTGDIVLDPATIRELHQLGAVAYFKQLSIEDLIHITQRLVGQPDTF